MLKVLLFEIWINFFLLTNSNNVYNLTAQMFNLVLSIPNTIYE